MGFEKKSPNWQANGVEPSETLKQSGFVAGYKPPATFFNWLFTRISDCITELQNKAVGEKTANGGEKFNDYSNNVVSGEYAHSEGFSTTATGNRSHSEGSYTIASGIGSHAEGGNNTASGNYSHAEGSENKATKVYTHAEGVQCEASGDASHAEGGDTTASGNYSHSQGFGTRALGANSSAGGARTTALGAYASSNGLSSNVITDIITDLSVETSNDTIIEKWTEKKFSLSKGIYSDVKGTNCLALNNGAEASGECCIAKNQNTHAEGKYTKAEGLNSHSEGSGSTASGDNSHSEGTTTEAIGTASHSEGSTTKAKGNYSHAEGLHSEAHGYVSHSQGCKTTAIGDYAHIEGLSSNKANEVISNLSKETPFNDIKSAWNTAKFSLALGTDSHVEGCNSLAFGTGSHVSGNATIAKGTYAVANGNGTAALGDSSKASGVKTTALGNYSTADGLSTNKADDVILNSWNGPIQELTDAWEQSKFSLAVGNASYVQGVDCFAGGNYSVASGKESHISSLSTCGFAHGNGVRVEGENAFAVGQSTNAGARATVAMGVNTKATDQFATALGSATHAKGIASTATGRGTIANGYGQFVAGKFNVEYDGATSADDTSGSIFIVGCGTGDTAKTNAFRITNAGKCMGTSSFSATGADYAEYFEWLDGNADNEDRRGYFVTFEGNKIRKATAEDDYILGVISATPSVVGNAYTDMWQGMYLKDVFGERLTESVQVPETVNEETGETIPEHTETRFIINPDYDHTRQYEGRNNRKEWACVGTHGQLIIIDDGSCEINKYCKPNSDGKATKSDEKTAFYVIERIDQNHVKVYIK